MPQLLAIVILLRTTLKLFRGTIMIKYVIATTVVAPFLATSAFAAPYVESKTTGAVIGGNYDGAQTEIRAGYEHQFTNKISVYGEIGPGYEWSNVGVDQGVAVTEIGATFPVSTNVGIKAKVVGEYGFDSEVFGVGGELKVRYTF